MPGYLADDGTRLAYHTIGEGACVICLPGGPMQGSAYLGDLGGLSGQLRLILMDYRGTGESQPPKDTATYRCDYLVDDLEALREHLCLERMQLLAHSAGANLAVLYAAAHPERIEKLVLVTPSTRAVGINATSEIRREIVRLRKDEPWFSKASVAFERVAAEQGTDEDWEAITPLTYGRWDAEAQAHYASGLKQQNPEATAIYGAEGAFDPEATRSALTTLPVPVLLIAGEVDVAAAPRVVTEVAGLFSDATLLIVPGAGHFPWLDDPTWFTRAVVPFLM